MTVSQVDESNFVTSVLQSELPVVLEFTGNAVKANGEPSASGNMTKVVDQLAQEYDGRLTVGRKKFVENGKNEKTYDVQSAPTTLFFKKGQLVRTVVGYYKNEGVFKTWVEELGSK
jgi:thioredoxin 1